MREKQKICRTVRSALHLSAENFFLDLVVVLGIAEGSFLEDFIYFLRILKKKSLKQLPLLGV